MWPIDNRGFARKQDDLRWSSACVRANAALLASALVFGSAGEFLGVGEVQSDGWITPRRLVSRSL